jgi:CheY-like chemotaxis protein
MTGQPPSRRPGRGSNPAPWREPTRDRLLSPTEIASLLRVDVDRVRAWARDGQFGSTKTPAGRVCVDPVGLVLFLEQRRVPVPRALRDLVRRRVLIIEDDATQRGALSRAFGAYRDRIAVAFEPSALGGLICAGAWRPHVVVLDVYRPGIDGVEACRRLKKFPETSPAVVVLASARVSPVLIAAGADAGAARVMRKPMDVAAIVELALACPAVWKAAP